MEGLVCAAAAKTLVGANGEGWLFSDGSLRGGGTAPVSAQARSERLTPLATERTGKIVTVYEAVVTCPRCGTTTRELMPDNACQHFYRCPGCDETLRPREGDCCVFCSYSDQICPPKQQSVF